MILIIANAGCWGVNGNFEFYPFAAYVTAVTATSDTLHRMTSRSKKGD